MWPLFDAAETFLFAPGITAPKKGPHVRDYVDLKRVMSTVIYALLPCLLFSIWNQGHQHFLALAAMAADGGAVSYESGWLQGLLFGSDYSPDVSAPGLSDKVMFGIQQMLPILFVSYFVGLNIEGIFSVIRKEEVSEGYLVTGILIALIVPASIPLWQLALAVCFSVILVKEIFGGTGMNIFNVALMARAFLFFGYPAQISGDSVWVAGNSEAGLIDGMSKPTPLAVGAKAQIQEAAKNADVELMDAAAAGVSGAPEGIKVMYDAKGVAYYESASDAVTAADYSWWDMFVGAIPGSAGETSALCAAIGAVILLLTGVASWRVMLSGVIGLLSMALLMNLTLADVHGIGSLSPIDHVVMGGFAFGIVFMATDPVTAPETQRGRWIYGFFIGAVTVLVRAVNPAYPEGVMLAVLLMNAATSSGGSAAMDKGSNGYIIFFAVAICVSCSAALALTFEVLSGGIEANKQLDIQKNILKAAGVLDSLGDKDPGEVYTERVRELVIDRESGDVIEGEKPELKDLTKIGKSKLSAPEGPEKLALFEVTLDDGGKVYCLPTSQYGLWSWCHGFLAVDSTGQEVRGITYYEQQETPGLGGEVENPKWQAQWIGKKLLSPDGEFVSVTVKKGKVDENVELEKATYVDGLAGATITSDGVTRDLKVDVQWYQNYFAKKRG
eukprot:jgi/Undpi1/11758/HiC_scaffold_37.g14053.m1